MELPPLTQHHLKRLLADGRWQKLRFHLVWSTALYCVFLLWLFSKLPVLRSHSFFTSVLVGLPLLVVSVHLVMALIDELPRARRDNMLELLALAGINPLGIWMRKAALTLFLALACLSCLVPLFLLLATEEHIRLATLVRHAVLALLVLLYLLSVTLLATIGSRDTGRSIVSFVALIAWSSLLLPVWASWLDKLLPTPWLGDHWQLFGPLYGYIRSLSSFKVHHGHFPMIAGGLLCWTALFFFLSHRLFDFRTKIPHASVRPAETAWLTLLLSRLTGRNDPATSSNPLAHLLHRERMNVLYAWGTSLGILGLMLFILFQYGIPWFKPFDLILTSFALVMALAVFTRVSAERIMADARREGLLELVLTTGLTPKEFVDGIESGITDHFRRLFWFAVAVMSVLAILGALIRPLNVQATISYCLLWAWIFYLCWHACFQRNSRSLWLALNMGRPAHSVAKLWLPAFLGIVFHGTSMLFSRKSGTYHFITEFPSGTALELTLIILASIVCLVLTAASFDDFTEETLLTHFREVATHPLPDQGDERIAKWDRSKIFPMPRDS